MLGTQKNPLNETVLWASKTYVLIDGLENIDNFTPRYLALLSLCIKETIYAIPELPACLSHQIRVTENQIIQILMTQIISLIQSQLRHIHYFIPTKQIKGILMINSTTFKVNRVYGDLMRNNI